MPTETVKAASLVLDYTLYPRHVVDSVHVTYLAEALRRGDKLPPVTAESKGRRVTDGFHRVKAALQVYGTEADIVVEWKDYADENAMVADAVARNSKHGRPYSPYDRARCICLLAGRGFKGTEIADALGITIERVEDLQARKIADEPSGGATPIKATLQHLAGERLTANQMEGNRQAGGMQPLYYVNQVINLIERGLVDPENERLAERLRYLAMLLAATAPKEDAA